jgi:hypothetical protein
MNATTYLELRQPQRPRPSDSNPDWSAAAFEANPGGVPEKERALDEPEDLSDVGEPVRKDEIVSSDDDRIKGGDLVGRTDPVRRCAAQGSRSLELPELQISRRTQGGDKDDVASGCSLCQFISHAHLILVSSLRISSSWLGY